MSSEPTTILMSNLKLSLESLSEFDKNEKLIKIKNYLNVDNDNEFKIDNYYFNFIFMIDEWNEGWNISGPIDSIILMSNISYGYYKKISWEELNKLKLKLDEISYNVCKEFDGIYEIFVSSGYW